MFDKVSKFTLLNKEEIKEAGFTLIRERYSFNTILKHNAYIVYLDEYKYNIYVLKFYLKAHKNSKIKYQLSTSLNEVQNVLATCLEIISAKKKSNPYASFAFLASRGLYEAETDSPKRYKIYSRVVKNFISPVDFEHFYDEAKGIYLLKNKHRNFDSEANIYLQDLIDAYTVG
jgi:hypothetical protein